VTVPDDPVSVRCSPGRRQILIEDPSGNPIQAAGR
jgi:hypothetical protein